MYLVKASIISFSIPVISISIPLAIRLEVKGEKNAPALETSFVQSKSRQKLTNSYHNINFDIFYLLLTMMIEEVIWLKKTCRGSAPKKKRILNSPTSENRQLSLDERNRNSRILPNSKNFSNKRIRNGMSQRQQIILVTCQKLVPKLWWMHLSTSYFLKPKSGQIICSKLYIQWSSQPLFIHCTYCFAVCPEFSSKYNRVAHTNFLGTKVYHQFVLKYWLLGSILTNFQPERYFSRQ